MKPNKAENEFTNSWAFKIGLVILGGIIVFLFNNNPSFFKNLSIYKASTLALQMSPKSCDESKTIQATKDSVVRITTDQGDGTGFIIKPDFILTNYHVVKDIDSPRIIFSDKTQIIGKVYNWDEKTDLAVIKVSKDNLKPLSFGDSDKLSQGQAIIGVGFPLGRELPGEATVTKGSYSARRNVDETGVEYIQIDASLNPGNSGSPIVTTCGDVVGILAASISGTEGLKFAISSKTSKSMSDSLIATGPKTVEATTKNNTDQSSPETTVMLYYDYISIRQLNLAWGLLTQNFQNYVQGYDRWIVGYNNTLNVFVLSLGKSDIADNIVKIKLGSVDDVNGQVSYKIYEGTYTLVQQEGIWRIDSANISQVQ